MTVLSDDDLKKIAALINNALDTRGVATKDELKEVLQNTASKDDLQAIKNDLKAMEERQDKKFEERYNTLLNNIVTNATFDERVKEAVNEVLDEKIKNLPTKEEFSARMDKLSGEYKKNDQEHTVQSGQITDHEDQLEDYEKRISALEQHPIIPA